jgi:hypothetical protein
MYSHPFLSPEHLGILKQHYLLNAKSEPHHFYDLIEFEISEIVALARLTYECPSIDEQSDAAVRKEIWIPRRRPLLHFARSVMDALRNMKFPVPLVLLLQSSTNDHSIHADLITYFSGDQNWHQGEFIVRIAEDEADAQKIRDTLLQPTEERFFPDSIHEFSELESVDMLSTHFQYLASFDAASLVPELGQIYLEAPDAPEEVWNEKTMQILQHYLKGESQGFEQGV